MPQPLHIVFCFGLHRIQKRFISRILATPEHKVLGLSYNIDANKAGDRVAWT
jgi:hypothetical protein